MKINEKLWEIMDRCTRCHGTGKEPGLIAVGGLSSARLRSVRRDGEIIWTFRCPSCGEWGDADDDQLHGRVSIDHTDTGCEFHETHDLWAMAGLD
jgi:uncharacterized C2H2 Zn-finger protein